MIKTKLIILTILSFFTLLGGFSQTVGPSIPSSFTNTGNWNDFSNFDRSFTVISSITLKSVKVVPVSHWSLCSGATSSLTIDLYKDGVRINDVTATVNCGAVNTIDLNFELLSGFYELRVRNVDNGQMALSNDASEKSITDVILINEHPDGYSGAFFDWVVEGKTGPVIPLPDTVRLCPGQTYDLNFGAYNGERWASDEPYTTIDDANIRLEPTQSTIYYFEKPTLIPAGENIVINGDFEAGNTGFTTEYVYNPAVSDEGEYFIGNQGSHAIAGASDHTLQNSSGMMYIADGSSTIVNPGPSQRGEHVWCQTLDVYPNTDYQIEFWARTGTNSFQFAPFMYATVNGKSATSYINTTSQWTASTGVWSSGSNTSMELCVRNGIANNTRTGNNFLLDDISVMSSQPVLAYTAVDSVVVIVESATTIDLGADANNCDLATTPVILDAGAGWDSYTWTPNGETTQTISVSAPGTYSVSATKAGGCSGSGDITFTATGCTACTPPDFTLLTTAGPICQGETKNFDVQLTSGTGPFTIYYSIDGVAQTAMTGLSLGTHSIAMTAQGVLSVDSVRDASCTNTTAQTSGVTAVNILPIVDLGSTTTICDDGSTPLTLDAGNAGATFAWSPNNETSQTAVANAAGTYEVTVTDGNNCSNTESITISETTCSSCVSGDNDSDGICDDVDLDDDNDGILDSEECPTTQVSTTFSTSGGTTTTFTAPAADRGFQFNIYSLDNSFNLNINGINLVSGEVQCQGIGGAGQSQLVFTSDNSGFGFGGSDQVFAMTGDINSPIIIVTIDKNGDVSFSGKRNTSAALEPMKINDSHPQPQNITWNASGPNTVILSQIVAGPTNISGEGFGLLSGTSCDEDGDGTDNHLDLDSDDDGCPDAIEGGASFTTTDLSSNALSGGVDANGVPVVAGSNGQALGSATDPNIKSPNCPVVCVNDNDNDGICDDVDLDDDNDGILDNIECPGLVLNSGNDGLTSGTAFTSLLDASTITTAGVYFFDIGGTTFSTYVNSNGYVQVALDYGNGVGALPQVTTMDNVTRGILSPTVLSQFSNATEIGITDSRGFLNVTTDNTTLINKLSNNVSLNTGVDDVSFQNDWIGAGAPTMTRASGRGACNDGAFTNLHENIFWPCGDARGMHWQPGKNFQRLEFSQGTNTGEIPNTESFTLWVKQEFSGCPDTDNNSIADYLDNDSDNDGCPDALEGDGGVLSSQVDANGMITGAVDANGIPTLIGNRGQNIGSSLDSTVQGTQCTCSEPTYTIGSTSTNICSGDSVLINITLNGTAPYNVYYTSSISGTKSVLSINSDKLDIKVFQTETISIDSVIDAVCTSTISKSATITVNPRPILTITTPATVCEPNTVDITDPIVTVTSTNEGTNTYFTDALATTSFTNPTTAGNGTYYIVTTTNDNCTDTAAVKVTVNTKPNLVITNPTNVCAPKTVDITNAALTATSTNEGTNTYFTDALATTAFTNPTSAGDGTYYILTTTNDNCTDTAAVKVTVNTKPNLIITDPTPVCTPKLIDLTSGTITAGSTLGGATISYYTNREATSLLKTPTVVDSGAYYIVVNNSSGCSDTAQVNVTINSTPIINLGNDTTICEGGSVFLNSGYSYPNHSFLWDTPNGLISDATSLSANKSGNYAIRVTSGSSVCYDEDTIAVMVRKNPIVNFGPDTSLCHNETMTLNASNTNATYIWNNSETTPTITVSKAGQYFVTVTDDINCIGSDTINIEIHKPFANLGNDTTICQGNNLLLDVGSTNYAILWSTKSTSQKISVSKTNTYSVRVSYSPICYNEDTIHVTVKDNPNVNLGGNTTIYDTEVHQLDAQNTGSFFDWNTNDITQTINASSEGFYNVTVTDSIGCKGYDEIFLTVLESVIIQNSFSPNGDGVNETWNIIGIDDYPDARVKVFNRWGNLLYSQLGEYEPWDGQNNGTDVPEGVYFYIISLHDKDKQTFSGSITILR